MQFQCHRRFDSRVSARAAAKVVAAFCLSATFISAASADPIVPQRRMGDPLYGLTQLQLQRFNVGKVKYNTPLTIEEGLGPCFNKSNCGNCHNNPAGGTGTQTVTRFGLLDKGNFDPLTYLGGSLLQAQAISPDCQEVVPQEANIVSLRVTNGALAFGLVEAIPDAAILAVRDAQPAAQQGVAHMVTAFEDPPPTPPDPPILHVGRFGWKAQVPTVLTFSADASLNEMGLTNRFVLQENAPNGNEQQLALCDTVADPEDGPDKEGLDFIDHVTFFQRYLSNAPQTPKSGMTGEAVFNAVGCNVCHAATFTTSNNPSLEDAIRNKVIHPYSDWLLHDMGLNGDFIVQGQGIGGFVKTPPLWGLRVRDPMWHDGRVAGGTFGDRVTAAIANHDSFGSQAQPSGQAFAALSQSDKDSVIAFLGSLGQAEFDADSDNDVQLDDFVAFHACYGSSVTPDSPCAIHDIDQDGDVDANDFNSFLLAYVGPRRDCNNNGIVDLRDILDGTLADANNNGIPDSFEPTCDADVNGSGSVNAGDLLAVINHWGACPASPAPCGADVDFDGVVNTHDLLAVINAWGACP